MFPLGTSLAGYNEAMLKRFALVILLVALVLGLALAKPAGRAAASSASVELTPFPTPTPGADGIIRYKVKPGDTLWRIAAVAGISVEKLRALNNMEPNESIRVGEILILGVGVSEHPSPTPTLALPNAPTPTPTKPPGEGTICILLYDDANGNGLYEEDTEHPLSDGAVSVSSRERGVSLTAKTKQNDFVCFNHLLEGKYTISMGVPPGYNPTTETTVRIDLQAGDTTYVTFGAQKAAPPPQTSQSAQKHSPLLGIIGGLFIVLAIVLWWYGRRLTSFPR